MEISKKYRPLIFLYDVFGNQNYNLVQILRMKVVGRIGNGIKSTLHGKDCCWKWKLWNIYFWSSLKIAMSQSFLWNEIK